MLFLLCTDSLLFQVSQPAFIFGGMLGIVLFVWREKRIKYPVLDVGLFMKNRSFTLSNIAALINYAATLQLHFY